MNDLKVFENEEFGKVRTIMIDDEPWFVGKDVANALGYENLAKTIRDHIDEEDKLIGVRNVTPYIIDARGRKQFPTFIRESGLYNLIFSSKLPNAKKFKRWVTSEVLPALRKTGQYQISNSGVVQMSEEKLIEHIGKTMSKMIKELLPLTENRAVTCTIFRTGAGMDISTVPQRPIVRYMPTEEYKEDGEYYG